MGLNLISQAIWDEYLEPNSKYVIAVSGGKDSVVLLHYLAQKLPSNNLVIAHFDHKIRPESATDATFVRKLAQQYKCQFELASAPIRQIAKTEGRNLEAVARNYRYQFLEQTREKHQAKAVITAHHQSDQLETVCLNFERGCGLRGLAGMPILSSARRILRPMLQTAKQQINFYQKIHHLEFKLDQTNHDTSYRRNRMRLVDLPNAIKAFSDWPQSALALSSVCAQLEVTATDPIYFWLRKNQIQPTKDLLRRLKTGRVGSRLISNNKLIKLQADGPTIDLDPLNPQPKPIKITNDSEQIHLWGKQKIQVKIMHKAEQTKGCLLIPASKLKGQLKVRSWQNGDRIQPLGLESKHKKLNRIFIDQKIPPQLRTQLPVICDDEKILGIPGIAISQSCCLDQESHCYFQVRLVESSLLK